MKSKKYSYHRTLGVKYLTLFFTFNAFFLCFIGQAQEYETPEGTLKQVEGEWRLFDEFADGAVDVSSIAILKKAGVQQSQVDDATNSLNLESRILVIQ